MSTRYCAERYTWLWRIKLINFAHVRYLCWGTEAITKSPLLLFAALLSAVNTSLYRPATNPAIVPE